MSDFWICQHHNLIRGPQEKCQACKIKRLETALKVARDALNNIEKAEINYGPQLHIDATGKDIITDAEQPELRAWARDALKAIEEILETK